MQADIVICHQLAIDVRESMDLNILDDESLDTLISILADLRQIED